jgi:hypothetical protein
LEKVSSNLEILSCMVLLIEANIHGRLTMTIEPISETLRALLVRQGLRGRTVGAECLLGKKSRESAIERSTPEFAAGSRGGTAREEIGGVAETSLSQWRVIRVRPSLKIADGGRK